MINTTGEKGCYFSAPKEVPITLSLGRRACKQKIGINNSRRGRDRLISST